MPRSRLGLAGQRLVYIPGLAALRGNRVTCARAIISPASDKQKRASTLMYYVVNVGYGKDGDDPIRPLIH